MRVNEVMTRDVDVVGPEATLQEAASRMRSLDVGSIPVVRDGKPVGMLTDRDIAVRAVAEGRDPAATTVGEVMTGEVVYVRESDWLDDAAEVMQARQVRRLMVVDEDERLCGIISLGDLSLRSDDDETSEETLEDVSWPGHPQGGGRFVRSTSPTSQTAWHAWKTAEDSAGFLAALVGGAALGAGLMYLFDPLGGRRRRALARDQVVKAGHRAQERVRRTAEYSRDRARGVAAETRARFRHDEPSDAVIRDRVRAAIGRAVSHPGAITVDARDGVVTLRGPVLADELDRLLDTARSVRGVTDVHNSLDIHETPGSVPGLQG